MAGTIREIMMVDLRQSELFAWQNRNFGINDYTGMQCALGMAEEVGEVCHHILKGMQGIRGGINGINKSEIADGVADVLIYGLQLLSFLGLDAEQEISSVITKVLRRDWRANRKGKESARNVLDSQ